MPDSLDKLMKLDTLMRAERIDINDVRQHVDAVQVCLGSVQGFITSKCLPVLSLHAPIISTAALISFALDTVGNGSSAFAVQFP